MPPPVRIEAKAWDDPRFAIMGRQLQVDRDLVLIKLARVWAHLTEEGLETIEPAVIDILTGLSGCAEAALRARLAEMQPNGQLRLSGTGGPRTNWLRQRRLAGRLGGRARAAAAARNPDGKFLPVGEVHHNSQRPSSDPDLAWQEPGFLPGVQGALFAEGTQANARQKTSTHPAQSSALSLSPALSPALRAVDLPTGDLVVAEPTTTPAEPVNGHGRGKERAPSRLRPAPKREERAIAMRVLERLSHRTDRSYSASAHVDAVVALLRQGYTEADLRTVVWDRCNAWLDDERMNEFCRPSTLFRPSKFPDYLAEGDAAWAKTKNGNGARSP